MTTNGSKENDLPEHSCEITISFSILSAEENSHHICALQTTSVPFKPYSTMTRLIDS